LSARACGLAFLLLLSGSVAGQLSEKVEKSPPVALGDGPGKPVTVEATYEEAPESPKAVWRRTLVRLRFKDGAGRLLSQETFDTRYERERGFGEEISADAPLELRGPRQRFMLLGLGFQPSAPSSGGSFVVYGFDRRGQFRRLGAPIEGSGEVIRNPRTAGVISLREGKYLDVSQWTGNFTLILPYEFQSEREEFEVAKACGKVEVDPQPPPDGTVVLRASRGSPAPSKSVPVTAASKIEFLDGCRGPRPDRPDEYTAWLHVRVDGEEGWVPTEEAARLGLPDAG
jgi:hypothetical protein